jgi:hypothetical protein
VVNFTLVNRRRRRGETAARGDESVTAQGIFSTGAVRGGCAGTSCWSPGVAPVNSEARFQPASLTKAKFPAKFLARFTGGPILVHRSSPLACDGFKSEVDSVASSLRALGGLSTDACAGPETWPPENPLVRDNRAFAF